MKILALIPARGGSKRLPDKNIRSLGGKPLIVWSIDVVKDMPDICDIIVSTDDLVIANIARAAGALVPWLRPADLSTDTASSLDVALHALDWYEAENGAIDGLLFLQPTSPFRSRETIFRGLDLFRQFDHKAVIGISSANSHPMWCFKVDGLSMMPFIDGGGLNLRSQDLPLAYVVNGAFYLTSPKDLRYYKSFFTDTMIPLVIEKPEEVIDIDIELDWKIAESIILDFRTSKTKE